MKYKISEQEKLILLNFKKLHIPLIFKADYINYMLFVEEVDFYVCETLLKGKEITSKIYEWIVSDSNNGHCPCFNDFIKGVNKSDLDENAKMYYDEILRVMDIFTKYKE